jgi:hypothetical protein
MVNSHIIRRVSFGLLERLGKLIKDHPEYVHISIEGHADERGAEDFNQRLSDARASSVLDFLVKAGVPRGRLSSKGFGSTRPLVDKKSEFAYYQNRRVEFIITREARVSGKSPVLPPKPPSLGQDGPLPPDVPVGSDPASKAPDPAAKPAPVPSPAPAPTPKQTEAPTPPPVPPNPAPPKSPAPPPASGTAGQAGQKGAQP